MGNWAVATPVPTYEWVADCPKCKTAFGLTTTSEERPHPHGVLCPECRARKLVVVGVLGFRKAFKVD